jgi:opacity protein-like surface antigen
MKKPAWIAVALVSLAAHALAANWVVLKDDKYGFAMLMPQGTKTASREWQGGWGGGYAKYGVTEFFGIAKLGVQAAPDDIEAFAIQASGVPGPRWQRVDQGKGMNGWKWWRTYRATDDTHVVFAVLGTGRRGSYCIFLKTTVADYNSGQEAYQRWYESLTLY